MSTILREPYLEYRFASSRHRHTSAVEHREERRGHPPARRARGRFFGGLDAGHGQGGDQGLALPRPSLDREYSVPPSRTNAAGSNRGRGSAAA